jgi:MYXO-CTERM domain-containing protein
VTTEVAENITAGGARMVGVANPNGSSASGWFRYGDEDPGVCSDDFGTRVPEADAIDLGEGMEEVDFDQILTNLEPSFTYYYCAAASNLGGAVFGEVESFTTSAAPPVVTTELPTIDDALAVTLNGTADPRGSQTTGWFRFDTTEPEACTDDFGTRVPAEGGVDLGNGRAPAAFTEALADLAGGTIYVCAIASNEAGIAFGEVVEFDVPASDVKAGPDTSDDGGCGCRVAPTPNGAVLPIGVAGLLLMVLWHRRRRA